MTSGIHQGAAPTPASHQPQQLLTDHLDLWTTAVRHKSTAGRGSGHGKKRKIELAGIHKLRELILELAVRGKLVPQNPADEPAVALLQRIDAEKARLVKEGKIKKQKPLPPVNDDEKPFELPEGWEWVRLTQIGMFSGGKTPSKARSDYWNGNIPWVSPKDMKTVHIEQSEDNVTQKAIDDGLELFPPETILTVVRSGILRHTLPVAITKVHCSINQDIKALKLHIPELSTYIHLLLKGFESFILNNLTKTGTTVESVKVEEFMNQAFIFPPLAEQQRIVAKVDELMALCDQLEQQSEHQLDAHQQLTETLLSALLTPAAGALTDAADAQELSDHWQRLAQHFDLLFSGPMGAWAIDRLKDTILQLAVMGKLVPQNPDDEPAAELLKRIEAEKARLVKDGLKTSASTHVSDQDKYLELPHSWEWMRLGNIAKFIDYRGKTPDKKDSGVRLITAKNIRFGFIDINPEEFISPDDYEAWMTRGFPRMGDMLFTTEAPLGNAALINLDEKFALAQRAICFQWHNPDIAKFMLLQVLALPFQTQLLDQATGMTATGIKASKLKEIPIILPPLAEQHRIVAKVDELMTLCDQLKERLQHASETQLNLTDAIVEQALS